MGQQCPLGPALPSAKQATSFTVVTMLTGCMRVATCRFIEPRPAINSYYKRVQQRPSWAQAFGPALSGTTAAKLFLPALAKAWWANLTGRY